jgi:hypothetical protein
MKNVVFCGVTPCGSCKKRRFGGTYHSDSFHPDDGDDTFLRNSIFANSTWRHALEDVIFHTTYHVSVRVFIKKYWYIWLNNLGSGIYVAFHFFLDLYMYRFPLDIGAS